MVGRLGPEAIGAVAVGSAVYYVPSLFGIGLLLGLDTLVAQAYGRDDHDACHTGSRRASISPARSPPLMLLLGAFSLIFGHVGIHAEVAGPAGSYLRVMIWGTLPLLLYGAVRRYLQGVGQMRVVTVTFVSANLLNWFGNWVLIYGKLGAPAMGVRGSALSTVISRVYMAASLIGFAWRYERSRGHPLFAHWAKPSLLKIKQLARLGAPAAGQLVAEVGAWNLATFSAGFLTPGGTRHPHHRPQLCQPHLHGAAGRERCRGCRRRACHRRRRPPQSAAGRMAGARARHRLHVSRRNLPVS